MTSSPSRCGPSCSIASTTSSRSLTLGLEQIEAIVTIHVDALAQRLGARNVALHLSDDAKLYLARVSIASGSGARYVQRTVSHYVSTPLSTALLRGELRDGCAAEVTLDGDALQVRAA